MLMVLKHKIEGKLCPMTEAPAHQRLYAETEEGSTVILKTFRYRHYRWRFWTMFAPAAETLAKFDRPPAYYRALFALMTTLDPVQFRRYSARELADAANMSNSSAERALAMLEADFVVIAKGKSAGKSRRLNNRVAWASNSEAHNLAEIDPEPRDSRGRL